MKKLNIFEVINNKKVDFGNVLESGKKQIENTINTIKEKPIIKSIKGAGNTIKRHKGKIIAVPAVVILVNAGMGVYKGKIKFGKSFGDRQEDFAGELIKNPKELVRKYGIGTEALEYEKATGLTILNLLTIGRNTNIYDEKPVIIKDKNGKIIDALWKGKNENISLKDLLRNNDINEDLLPIIVQIIESEADLSNTFVNVSRTLLDEDIVKMVYNLFGSDKKFSKSALRTKDGFNKDTKFLKKLANFKIKQYGVGSVPVYYVEGFKTADEFVKHVKAGGKIKNSDVSFSAGVLHIQSLNDFFEKNKTSSGVIKNLITMNLENHKISNNYFKKVLKKNDLRLLFIASFYPTDTTKTLSGVFYQNLVNIGQFNQNFSTKCVEKPLHIDGLVGNNTKIKGKQLGFSFQEVKKKLLKGDYSVNNKIVSKFIKNYEKTFNNFLEYLRYIESINNDSNKGKKIKSPLSNAEIEFYNNSMNYLMNISFELQLSTLIAYQQFLDDNAKYWSPEPGYEFMSKENVKEAIEGMKNGDKTEAKKIIDTLSNVEEFYKTFDRLGRIKNGKMINTVQNFYKEFLFNKNLVLIIKNLENGGTIDMYANPLLKNETNTVKRAEKLKISTNYGNEFSYNDNGSNYNNVG